MTSLLNDSTRRLVPRWRYMSSLAPAETVADRTRRSQPPRSEMFWEEKCRSWVEDRRIETAAELLACAVALNRLSAVQDVIGYLSERRGDLVSGVQDLVAYAYDRVSGTGGVHPTTVDPGAAEVSVVAEAQKMIANCRRRLSDTPRDALAWMDMALGYTTLGQPVKAEQAMGRALLLAPNHRLIVRAACRRLLHAGRASEAHRLLLRHSRTRSDPWFIAAEIAIAQVLEEAPRLVREGRQLLASGHFSPAGITELAGALGTLEYASGATKQARRLFQLSMEAPSDNAVAQARWIAARTGGIVISEEAWRTPRAFEAWCWRAFQARDWVNSFGFAKEWVRDEPFSSRAAVQATFLATTVFQDYEYAIRCGTDILRADNADAMLRNNLIVALAYGDKLDQARREAELLPSNSDPARECVFLATRGLVEFRSGAVGAGRALYRRAFDCASADLRLRVVSHWLKEELRLERYGSEPVLERAAHIARAQRDYISLLVLERAAAENKVARSETRDVGKSLADVIRLLQNGEE